MLCLFSYYVPLQRNKLACIVAQEFSDLLWTGHQKKPDLGYNPFGLLTSPCYEGSPVEIKETNRDLSWMKSRVTIQQFLGKLTRLDPSIATKDEVPLRLVAAGVEEKSRLLRRKP